MYHHFLMLYLSLIFNKGHRPVIQRTTGALAPEGFQWGTQSPTERPYAPPPEEAGDISREL